VVTAFVSTRSSGYVARNVNYWEKEGLDSVSTRSGRHHARSVGKPSLPYARGLTLGKSGFLSLLFSFIIPVLCVCLEKKFVQIKKKTTQFFLANCPTSYNITWMFIGKPKDALHVVGECVPSRGAEFPRRFKISSPLYVDARSIEELVAIPS
jgi:hypothetical protein